ncbi:hypothetical protein Nepgr_013595 [Nepenthes gracilis]|uniref:Uncharacterized protein n=1 Tax=Nepenthes gracilis TaxID=150966 RepID=A0AAD3SJ58_NEPGR|nr:hypothetical protein Nepgr_013595 [Nepenthes gracilis]
MSRMSVQSKRHRRHRIAGSFVRDDGSLGRSFSVLSYMALMQSRSAKNAKTNLTSPLGVVEKNGITLEKGSAGGPVKKRLFFPAFPVGPRRYLVPGKIESNPIKDVAAHPEERVVSKRRSRCSGSFPFA